MDKRINSRLSTSSSRASTEVYRRPISYTSHRDKHMDIVKPKATSTLGQRPIISQSQPNPSLLNVVDEQSKAGPKVRLSKVQTGLLLIGLVIFCLGVITNLQTIRTNQDTKVKVAAIVNASNGGQNDVPSESRPNTSSTYQVAPMLPKYIKIDKLGVNARVIPLSVSSNNQLKAPSNIYDAGWYESSARPGDPGSNGAALIDGHVHGPTLPGVFADLSKLNQGDIIQIVRGDNQVFSYAVSASESYELENMDMSRALASIQPGRPGLNLITCAGKYDKKAGQYTQRTMVLATAIN